MEVDTETKGIEGQVSNVVYLGGYAFAPDNLVLSDGHSMEMTDYLVNAGFSDGHLRVTPLWAGRFPFPHSLKSVRGRKAGGLFLADKTIGNCGPAAVEWTERPVRP